MPATLLAGGAAGDGCLLFAWGEQEERLRTSPCLALPCLRRTPSLPHGAPDTARALPCSEPATGTQLPLPATHLPALQLRFAVHSARLALVYCANILLLPSACAGRLGSCAATSLAVCLAFGCAHA
jgi:hypothetical protein